MRMSKYDGIDWSRPVTELAEKLGVTIEAIYVARNKRGIRMWQHRLVPDAEQPFDCKFVQCKCGTRFKVDTADYDTIKQHCWYLDNNGRAYARINKKLVIVHRLLFNERMDHKNGDPLDNRRGNLRPATQQQNCCNRRKTTNLSSRFKGVSYTPGNKTNPWQAYITCHHVKHHIGYFINEENAARAYDNEAIRLHAEFANLNFPLDGTPAVALP